MAHFFPFRFAFKRLNPVDSDNLGAGFLLAIILWIIYNYRNAF